MNKLLLCTLSSTNLFKVSVLTSQIYVLRQHYSVLELFTACTIHFSNDVYHKESRHASLTWTLLKLCESTGKCVILRTSPTPNRRSCLLKDSCYKLAKYKEYETLYNMLNQTFKDSNKSAESVYLPFLFIIYNHTALL